MRRDTRTTMSCNSSFLSCEKDTETILRRLFVESYPYSDTLKRLLVINTKDCLDNNESEVINKTISVTDIFSENCQLTDGKTGEVKTMPRIVLIDKDGVSYQCVSYGIYNSIKKLIQIYGLPTWEEPIDLLVKQIKAGDKNILSLEIV